MHLYADDIMLLSHPLNAMQFMLKICDDFVIDYDHILKRIDAFLCQIGLTCFGGDGFPRGLIVRVKIFPLLNPQNYQFSAHFGL